MLNNPKFSPFGQELCLKPKYVRILTPLCLPAAEVICTSSSMHAISILRSLFFLSKVHGYGNMKIYHVYTIIDVQSPEETQ